VSQFGTTISQVALPLLAILVLHATTFEVGLLTTLETLAFLLVGLPAGAWVDRMRFRSVLIANDLLRAALLGSIPVAHLLGVLTLAQLYIVTVAVGVCTVFFDVAYQSYLPTLIDRRALVEGNAKLQASESVSQIVGPSVGGLLIQAFTAPYAIVVDALSFLWSGGWVLAIKHRSVRPERRPERRLHHEIAEGLRFVGSNRLLRSIAACTGISNFSSSMVNAVIFVLLARELGLSAGLIGLVTSLSALGGLLGALVAPRVTARLGQGPTIWISMAVTIPCGFVAPFVHRDWTLALYATAQLLFWGSAVVYNITQVGFRQGLCPPRLLGRMNATMRFLVWGTMPLGALVGGSLGATLGVRDALLVAAVIGVVPVLPVYFSPLRRMKELPAYQDPAPTSATG
jgi:MFS family permease